MSYDQWKTASPYDDMPDWVEIAQDWLNAHANAENADEQWANYQETPGIIEGLLNILSDEGII